MTMTPDDAKAAWAFMGACARAARLAHGYDIETVAEAVGVDKATLSRFEHGKLALRSTALRPLLAHLELDAATAGRMTPTARRVGTCAHCGESMQLVRRSQRFCGTRCRVANHRGARPAGPHVVYFLRRGDLVKIGTTCRLEPRIRSFQQTMADVLATIPGDDAVEREWHARFAHLLDDAHGGREWFRLTDELRQAIDSARGGQ